jgi:hypothetical protein
MRAVTSRHGMCAVMGMHATGHDLTLMVNACARVHAWAHECACSHRYNDIRMKLCVCVNRRLCVHTWYSCRHGLNIVAHCAYACGPRLFSFSELGNLQMGSRNGHECRDKETTANHKIGFAATITSDMTFTHPTCLSISVDSSNTEGATHNVQRWPCDRISSTVRSPTRPCLSAT